MTLILFDYGRFENLSRIFDRKLHYRQRNFSIDVNNSSEVQLNSEAPSKDEEADDVVSPISTVCQGHVMRSTNSDRRMSVPQLSRNKSIVKAREQRIASVVGVPHRHHITIAVNDEPVDIIKTTCTGPCLQSCHINSSTKSNSSLPTHGVKFQNKTDIANESRSTNQSTNIILMTLIYVISTLSVRSIINLYIILNDISNTQRKITLAFLYFFSAMITLTLSLNCFSKPIKSITVRVELVVSVVMILIWSGLHLIPISSWPWLIFTAVLLAIGSSLLWDSQITMLSKWSIYSSSRSQIHAFNDIMSHANIIPTTSVIGHSLHIWSSVLIFILLETMSSNTHSKSLNLSSFPMEITDKYNDSKFKSNFTDLCGIYFKNVDQPKYLKVPDRTMYCLFYICIGLNVVSLILVVLLLDKSRTITIPSHSQDKDAIHPMIVGHMNQNVSNPIIVHENWVDRIKSSLFIWIRKNSKTLLKLWKCQTLKFTMPTLFTMGLVEGFFISDYNQNFISCYKKPSFIGISMLMFSIGPIAFVNIFPFIAKLRMIEIFSFPISRAIFLCSFLLLALTKVGSHWSYLLVFFPWVIALDNVICLAIFYISASSLPNNLLDSSIVIQRVLRMLGIAIYSVISGAFGTLSALIITILAHIFISPLIIVLGSLVRCSKN